MLWTEVVHSKSYILFWGQNVVIFKRERLGTSVFFPLESRFFSLKKFNILSAHVFELTYTHHSTNWGTFLNSTYFLPELLVLFYKVLTVFNFLVFRLEFFLQYLNFLQEFRYPVILNLTFCKKTINLNFNFYSISSIKKRDITLQSKMNAKHSNQRFWHCYENDLIKTGLS